MARYHEKAPKGKSKRPSFVFDGQGTKTLFHNEIVREDCPVLYSL